MPRQWTLLLYGVMLVCAADIAAVFHLNGIYPFIAILGTFGELYIWAWPILGLGAVLMIKQPFFCKSPLSGRVIGLPC